MFHFSQVVCEAIEQMQKARIINLATYGILDENSLSTPLVRKAPDNTHINVETPKNLICLVNSCATRE